MEEPLLGGLVAAVASEGVERARLREACLVFVNQLLLQTPSVDERVALRAQLLRLRFVDVKRHFATSPASCPRATCVATCCARGWTTCASRERAWARASTTAVASSPRATSQRVS